MRYHRYTPSAFSLYLRGYTSEGFTCMPWYHKHFRAFATKPGEKCEIDRNNKHGMRCNSYSETMRYIVKNTKVRAMGDLSNH